MRLTSQEDSGATPGDSWKYGPAAKSRPVSVCGLGMTRAPEDFRIDEENGNA